MGFKRKLCKIFAAVAIFGGALTVAAPPAQAISPAAHVAIVTTSNATAANAAAAARQRQDREAKNEVIVNPTEAAITKLRERGLVDYHAVKFVREAVHEMHVPVGIRADSVTEEQRDRLAELVNQKWLVEKMSADNAAGAQTAGLSESLAKYFDATKAELGHSGVVTLEQAREMEKTMETKQWELDTKPALKTAGAIAGGIAVGGVAIYAMAAKYRKPR